MCVNDVRLRRTYTSFLFSFSKVRSLSAFRHVAIRTYLLYIQCIQIQDHVYPSNYATYWASLRCILFEVSSIGIYGGRMSGFSLQRENLGNGLSRDAMHGN